MALRFEGVPQHRPERVLVLDEEYRKNDRWRAHLAHPAGTFARRASSWMSVMVLVYWAISPLTRVSSSIAFCRSAATTVRCAGSSRLTKSAERELMRVC